MYGQTVVAVFQEDTFYTPTQFYFTFKTKLRHLNKKWYPGGVQLMHTVVRYYQQLTLRPKQASKSIVCVQKHTFMLFMTFTLHFQPHLMKSLKCVQ